MHVPLETTTWATTKKVPVFNENEWGSLILIRSYQKETSIQLIMLRQVLEDIFFIFPIHRWRNPSRIIRQIWYTCAHYFKPKKPSLLIDINKWNECSTFDDEFNSDEKYSI